MTEFVVFLVALLIVNILVSRRVVTTGRRIHLPVGMLLAAIWLFPLGGAFIAFLSTPWRRVVDQVVEDAGRPDRGQGRGTPPEELAHPSGGASFSVVDHLQWGHELPVLDWQALGRWADGASGGPVTGEQRVAALEAGRRAWLQHLAEALGPQMGLLQMDEALVLSSLNEREARATADYVHTARLRIERLLGPLASFPAGQRSLVLVLDSEDDYYRYVSLYHPDGEFAVSGGMFIDAGCPHFVVVRAQLGAIEPVIAHELTHSALAHLRLPRWLDEGIAVNSERRVAGARPLLHTALELHVLLRDHWNAAKVQGFWSGESFLRADDDTLLSYELARILVEQMSRDWDGFAAFVRAAAHATDAGEAAAREALGLDLGACAASVVEAPSSAGWAPQPELWR